MASCETDVITLFSFAYKTHMITGEMAIILATTFVISLSRDLLFDIMLPLVRTPRKGSNSYPQSYFQVESVCSLFTRYLLFYRKG